MKKSEISEELMTKIKIELDTLFYMPGEAIKGTIKLYPGFKLQIKNNKLHLKLKILQYEFWEYTNMKIDELKNIYKTEISQNDIIYELKENEQLNVENNNNYNISNSIVIIEKEDSNKCISIPFEYIINNNILPTFQFETEKYILGIRHLLIVECNEFDSVNYIGLFIGKQQDINLSEQKQVDNKYKAMFDEVDISIKFEKQSFYFGEDIKWIIKNKSKYTFESGTITYKQVLYRKIQWMGYLKNTLLDKKIYLAKIKENSKKKIIKNEFDDDVEVLEEAFEIFEFFGYPFLYSIVGEGVGGVCGAIIGGIICPHVLLGMFLGGALSFFIGGMGGAMAGYIAYSYSPGDNDFINGFNFKTKKENKNNDEEKSKENNNNNNDEKLKLKEKEKNEKLKAELEKFVYFKNNKIIGFIKFRKDITPPVNGYYFKCDFTLKIDVEVSGPYSNGKKEVLKNKIDFYDGENYIEKMKKLLNTNSII
jgi:hypothetical protein